MKKALYLTLFWALFATGLWAQFTPSGMNYQAVARDASGQVLAQRQLRLRISLTGPNETWPHYTETHQLQTDDFGLFNLVVGRGIALRGAWENVPWASTEGLWLQVELAQGPNDPFVLLSRSPLQAVPYAFHALSADHLTGEAAGGTSAKNQSVNWTTSGNSRTNAQIHFLGTRDRQPLIFKTNNQRRLTLTETGRLVLNPSHPSGKDDNKNHYAFVIDGSRNNQGIWIKINESRTTKNNFVTFEDSQGVVGRIEGQTISELKSTGAYKSQVAVYALTGASLIAQSVALYAESVGLAASGWAAGAVPGVIAQATAIVIEAAALLTESISWGVRIEKEIGVTYASGSGDYAEWLERAPGERDMEFGEVVGVKGGLISLNTSTADHFMVISRKPIVLGNEPSEGARDRYEKVAFMGQVPVRVAGPVQVGDYILPSGNHDGLAVAVNPTQMQTGDYRHIIGVAWEAGDNTLQNLVNVAVGINGNDVAQRVAALSQQLEHIVAYLEGKSSSPHGPVGGGGSSLPVSQFSKQLTDANFDQFVDQHADLLRQMYQEAAHQMTAQGESISPELQAFFADPIPLMKQLRRDPQYLTQWSMVDRTILNPR